MAAIVKEIERLREPARTACKLFMDECKKRNIDIFLVETLRTVERQQELYNRHDGSTNCDGIRDKSKHQSGLAWDIASRGPILYDKNIIDRAGALGLQMGITWGGSWGWDSPHFEVAPTWKPKVMKPIISKTKLKLNEAVKQVDTILKDGHNFIKIRDIQDSKISISYTAGKVFVNGIHYAGDMINLDGNNFIKLRDLPGVKVIYDNEIKMPVVSI